MTTPAAVKTASGYTEFFEIVSGVRQSCILSPFLFIIVIDFVMHRTMDKSEYGIVWQKRNRLTDLDFADDIAIVAEEVNVCHEMTIKLEKQSAQVQVGLNTSREPGKNKGHGNHPAPITTANSRCTKGNIEYVERVTYLGSVISSDGDVEADISTRLAKAAAVFRRLDNM